MFTLTPFKSSPPDNKSDHHLIPATPFRKALPALFAAVVMGTAAAQSTVNLAWNQNPESNVNKYNVLIGTSSGSLSVAQTVTSPAATLSGLSPATTYYCAVQAVNTDNLTSPRSSVINFTTSPANSTGPEIAVERAGGNLTDGSSSVNFGSVQTGSSSGNQTFTIRNTGNANLTGLSLSKSGGQASEFINSGLSTTTLAPGASTTFTVRFAPGSTGSRSTTFRIASNDANENPFDIALSGTGTTIPTSTAPEIVIQRASGSNLYDGWSSATFGSVDIGKTDTAQTFTIRNTGDANLTGLALSTSGSHGSDFTASGLSKTTLAPGENTTFSVNFKPTGTGTRSATLRVASNDANENPFDLSLRGTGTSAPIVTSPEIAIQRAGGGDMTDGSSSVNFASTKVGNPASAKTFTIRNLGNANLTGLALSMSGSHSSDFIASGLSKTTLAPGASTTFSINFKPTATGSRNATLRVASNDANESSFDISLRGTGTSTPIVTSPEIAIQRAGGGNLTDGSSSANFASTKVGNPSSAQTFTIRNLGNANLTGLALSKNGAHSADFTVSGLAKTTLAPGASTTFSVNFTPTATGARSAALLVASNDANENPFNISLGGTGTDSGGTVLEPEIEVILTRSEPVTLTSGKSTATFGKSRLRSEETTRYFTIRNTGNAPLSGLEIATLGKDASHFIAGTLEKTTLAPNESTEFWVAFKPKWKGAKKATLRIINNDADENPFEIKLVGKGLPAPKIDIRDAAGNSFADRKPIIDHGSSSVGKWNKPTVITITNNGNSTLKNLSLVKSGVHRKDFPVGKLKVESLAPGESTTLKIGFQPGSKGARRAFLSITSNDPANATFRIKLLGKGKGVGKGKRKMPTATVASTLEQGSAPAPAPARSNIWIDGEKYRSITVRGSGSSVTSGDIQVSGNLVDWSSGRNHTTVDH